ncbi:MAG: hypothetical protein ACE5JX_00140 [Acidobacteriota bacterium]
MNLNTDQIGNAIKSRLSRNQSIKQRLLKRLEEVEEEEHVLRLNLKVLRVVEEIATTFPPLPERDAAVSKGRFGPGMQQRLVENATSEGVAFHRPRTSPKNLLRRIGEAERVSGERLLDVGQPGMEG